MKYKFVEVTSYAPEQYNILDENDTLVAFLRMRWGKLEVHQYINGNIDWNTIMFKLDFGHEYLGAIPDDMKDNIFETISNKINDYGKND